MANYTVYPCVGPSHPEGEKYFFIGKADETKIKGTKTILNARIRKHKKLEPERIQPMVEAWQYEVGLVTFATLDLVNEFFKDLGDTAEVTVSRSHGLCPECIIYMATSPDY